MESAYYAPFWAANPILYIQDYCQRALQLKPIISFQANEDTSFTCMLKLPDTEASIFYGSGRTKKDSELDAAFSCCMHINKVDVERVERLCELDLKARTKLPPQHQSAEWSTKVIHELQKALGCTPKANYHDAIRYWICEVVCGTTVGVGKSGSKKHSQILAFSDLTEKVINNHNNQNCNASSPIQDISELKFPPPSSPPTSELSKKSESPSTFLPSNKTPKQYLNEWAQRNYNVLPLVVDSFEDERFSCIVTVPPAMETLPGHGIDRRKQGANQQAAMDFLVKNGLLAPLASSTPLEPLASSAPLEPLASLTPEEIESSLDCGKRTKQTIVSKQAKKPKPKQQSQQGQKQKR